MNGEKDQDEAVRSGERPSLQLRSCSAAQTLAIGRCLGAALGAGDCVALVGDLGAGKTCLTQGIARGLGVSNDFVVTSPTFTLINEYPGRVARMIHMDAYRLAGTADLADMGFDEYLLGGDVLVIEWAEKIREALPAETLWIHCVTVSEKERRLEIAGPAGRLALLSRSLEKGGC